MIIPRWSGLLMETSLYIWGSFMICSIQKIILRLLRRRLKLHCPKKIWLKLFEDLKEKSGGRRESGAFLIGNKIGNIRYVEGFILYDELDPECLDTGIVVFSAKGFRKLWKLCRESGLCVVADIHTHPGSAFQSHLDKTNPMIAEVGHLAFIVPDYAVNAPALELLGIYEYLQCFCWANLSGKSAKEYIHI